MVDSETQHILRACIQKVATGPEYSKDLSYEESRAAMTQILANGADPVQAAVFFIALRMKRETDDENKGVLQALLDATAVAEAPVDELIDVADPYDGHTRGLPVTAFIPTVLAACGVPAVNHGLESVGPKHGVTARKVLRAAGVNVDLAPHEAAGRLAAGEAGWAYVDQQVFCKPLHDLTSLRQRIVKRPVLTTVEVLTGPVRARGKTHLLTGYVHKAYPPVYAELARYAGFDSAMIVRGVEGGVIPSLQQPAKLYFYHDKGQEQLMELNPRELGIEQSSRAVPLPSDLPAPAIPGENLTDTAHTDAAATAAAEYGMAALEGKSGPARDSLVYSCAICLSHLGRYETLSAAADAVRTVLDSGEALTRLKA